MREDGSLEIIVEVTILGYESADIPIKRGTY
jgi:hypothetical protein